MFAVEQFYDVYIPCFQHCENLFLLQQMKAKPTLAKPLCVFCMTVPLYLKICDSHRNFEW